GLHDWHCPGNNAGIVPSFARYGDRLSFFVDALLVLHDRGHRFKRYVKVYVFTVGYPSLDPTRMVGACSDPAALGVKLVVMLRSPEANTGKTTAVFKTLDGVDAQHCLSQL